MHIGNCLRRAASMAAIAAAAAAAGIVVAWPAEKPDSILAHGPWPPTFVRDPANRVSGQPRAIELGRRLFFDPRMSPSGYMACVSCHQPDRAFTDIKARAHGLADLERNTIALANLRQQHWYGWGGSSDSLWAASLRPILDAREFDGSAASVMRLFRRDEDLERCYRSVFGGSPFEDDEATLVNVGKALAAFLETLTTGRTPFDDYRDALERGDRRAASRYPPAARRGLRIFVGSGECERCHRGPNFSDGEFHATGFSSRRNDSGRQEGIREWQDSRFNLRSRYNDAAPLAMPPLVSRNEGDRGAFRTPSLRNVAATAPYMHDGSIETLHDVVRQHGSVARAGQSSSIRYPAFSDREVDDLVAFLRTLTDAQAARRAVPVAVASCAGDR